MQALVTAPGSTAIISQIPIPEPGPNEIRIKVHSIALNPVDSLYVAHPPTSDTGRVVGSDVVGTVDVVGTNIQSEKWAIGDRVGGLLQGATSGTMRPGGFSEYAVLESDIAFRVPKNASFDEAATFPLCALTAAQALFVRLQLPAPFPHPFSRPAPDEFSSSKTPTLLVYSASTSLGLFTVQLAKLITPTIRVIATASPANHALLLSLGASQVFDYRSPTWVSDVQEASEGGIDFAVDCISEDKSTGMISECFNEDGRGEKRIAVIRKAAWDKNLVRKDVTALYGAAWVGLGHEIVYNNEILLADPTHRAFTVAFYEYLSAASSNFPIKANPVRLMPGGLHKIVEDGFALIGSGKVADRKADRRKEAWMKKISAEKLVYRVGA